MTEEDKNGANIVLLLDVQMSLIGLKPRTEQIVLFSIRVLSYIKTLH